MAALHSGSRTFISASDVPMQNRNLTTARMPMPLTFKRSWNDEDLERYRASTVRFIETEMLPDDEAARRRGHVGHAIWRRAGELGFLCADIPEAHGGGGGDFRHEAVFYEETARRGLTGM